MEVQRRFLVVLFSFLGLLVSIGFRAIFAITLAHVIAENKHVLLNNKCKAKDESFSVNITKSDTEYFNTVYFLGTMLTQIPGGYLATRFSSSRVCGLSIFGSSFVLLFFPLVIQFAQKNLEVARCLIYIMRALQGLFEGSSVPALNGVISAWAPKSEKARMVTVAYAGAYLSPAVAMFVAGRLSCDFTWTASLYIYGGAGVIWTVFWFVFIYDTPADHPTMGNQERELLSRDGANVQSGNRTVAGSIPWKHILMSLPVYAVFVGSFCRNWIFSLAITVLPNYFKDVHPSLNIKKVGLFTGLPEVCMTVFVIIGGLVFDRLIKKKIISVTIGRKLAQCTGFGIEAACLFVVAFKGNENHWLALSLFCVGVGFSGLAVSGYAVNMIDLAPQYASILTGFSRLGTVGSVLGTAFAGFLIPSDKPRVIEVKQWRTLFLIAGSIHAAGVIFYGIFASGKRQSWAIASGEHERLINPAVNRIGIQDPAQEYDAPYSRDRDFSKSYSFGSTRSDTDKSDSDDDTPSWFLSTI